jgi:hypothetical protein
MLRLETDFSDGGAGTRLMRAVGEILRVGLTVYFR